MNQKIIKSYSCLAIVIMTVVFASADSYAQNVPDEAKKYYNRGQAAIELATTQVDYQEAVSEFNKSINIAPGWAEPYRAVAQVYEKLGNYSSAIGSYKKYLTISPSGVDADAVKTSIDKLEYKLDKQNEKSKIINVLTSWNEPGSRVHFTKSGGAPCGVYVLKKFIFDGNKLLAYIPYCLKDSPIASKAILVEQTVPVDFDGRTMKYSYKYYGAPTSPQLNYGEFDVKITAELVSTSPIKFNVTEQWRLKRDGSVDEYSADWTFSE